MRKKDLINQLEEVADCCDTGNVDESRGYYMGIQAAIKLIKDAGSVIYDDETIKQN